MAAGSGTRMDSEVPKQFLILKDKPVLLYSLQAFFDQDPNTQIILVLASQELPRWDKLCNEYAIVIPHQIVIGGNTRTASVQNGLNVIKTDGLVAIHDGARPLISTDLIQQCFLSAQISGSGVASVKPKDSIRQVSKDKNQALDREALRLIQTPQTFQVGLIKAAFVKYGNKASSDDATILEKAGHLVRLVEGSYHNIKITTPEDMILAEALL